MVYVNTLVAVMLSLMGWAGTPVPTLTPAKQLVIKAQPWTSRSCTQPPSSTRRLVVFAGEHVEVRGLGQPVTVEVVDVTPDGVRIRLSESMGAATTTGGVSFTDLRREFVVTSGKVTRFGTPSLDGGVNYEVHVADGR